MARVPVIRIGNTLIASVLEELYDADAARLREELASSIERTGARGVLLDLSVVDTVDSYLGRMISDIAATTSLLGAQTVVVGIQPAVAITLVELGLDLSGVRTALNPEKGMVLLQKLIEDSDLRLMTITEDTVPIAGESDIVLSRQRAREAAKALGFSLIDQSRIATAVSELTRNVVRYATNGHGKVVVRPVTRTGGGSGIEVVVSDDGPGIADVESVMLDGFTTGPGLGLGLPGTRRLMDEMLLESDIGRGTTVTIRKWRR